MDPAPDESGPLGSWGDEAAETDALTQSASVAVMGGMGARGYVSVEGVGEVLEVVTRVFKSASSGRPSVASTRLMDMLAVNIELQNLHDVPARARSSDGVQEALSEVLEDMRRMGPQEVTLEDVLGFFGLGGPSLEQVLASSSGPDLGASELDEDVLIRSIQNELLQDFDGAAKMIVLGGLGASMGARSVFRVWPKVWAAAAGEGAAPAKEIFEDAHGTTYLLNDMHVLDLATLQWSRPQTNGAMDAKMGHSVVVVPTRITAEPKYKFEQDKDVGVAKGSIFRHLKEIYSRLGDTGDAGMYDKALYLIRVLLHCLESTGRTRGMEAGIVSTELVRRTLEPLFDNTSAVGHLLAKSKADTPGYSKIARLRFLLFQNKILCKSILTNIVKIGVASQGSLDEIAVQVDEFVIHKDIDADSMWLSFKIGKSTVQNLASSVVERAAWEGAGAANRPVPLSMMASVSTLGNHSVLPALQDVISGSGQTGLQVELKGARAQEHELVLGTAEIDLLAILAEGNVFKERVQVKDKKGADLCSFHISIEAQHVLKRIYQQKRKTYLDSFSLVAVGGRGVLELDGKERARNSVSVYDAAANVWSEKELREGIHRTSDHAADCVGSDIYVFGGKGDDGTPHNQLYRIDARSWDSRRLNAMGKEPAPRHNHTSCAFEGIQDSDDWALVYYGGTGEGGQPCDTIPVLHGTGGNVYWREPTVGGFTPKARTGHAAAVVKNGNEFSMYVFGGAVADADGKLYCTDDLYALVWQAEKNAEFNMEWKIPATKGPTPPARRDCTMVALGKKLLLSHGWLGMERAPWVRDFWILDTNTGAWASLGFVDHFPSARYAHAVALADFRASVPSNATLEGSALSEERGEASITAFAGEPVDLTLQARDIRGLLAQRHGENFYGYLRTVDGRLIQASEFIHAQKAEYRMEFTPVLSGTFELFVVGDGDVQVRKSPIKVKVMPAPVTHQTCILCPCEATLTPGAPLKLLISALDGYGNVLGKEDLERISSAFKVEAKGPESFGVEIAPAEDSFVATVTLKRAGQYRFFATFQGKPICGSGFQVECVPGAASVADSKVEAETLQKLWFAGSAVDLRVQAYDSFGNEVPVGGLGLKAEARPAGTADVIPVPVADNGDGTYGLRFLPTGSGDYEIAVASAEGGAPLAGSPYKLFVSSGLLDYTRCTYEGLGLTGQEIDGEFRAVKSGEPYEITLTTYDQFGNLRIGGKDLVRVFVVDSKGQKVEGKALDNKDGTYTCTYVAQRALPSEIFLEVACGYTKPVRYESILKETYRVNVVPGSTYGETCTAVGEGVKGYSLARKPTSFTVYARDRFLNRVSAGGDDVRVVMRAGWEIPVEVVDNGDGSYRCTYVAGSEPEFSGRTVYSITVTLGGQPILYSPFYQSICPARTSASHSEVTKVPSQITAGETTEFIIQARDESGQENTRGTDFFHIELKTVGSRSASTGKILSEVKDLKNGKYQIKVFPVDLAYYKLSMCVYLEGQHIRGSPYDVMVVPTGLFNVGFWGGFQVMDDSAANTFTLAGNGLKEAVSGKVAEFDIVANRMDFSLTGQDFVLELRGPDFITGIVDDAVGGIYRGTYCPTRAGTYVATVKLGRFPLPGCPFHIQVRPNTTFSGACEIDAVPLERVSTQKHVKLKLFTHDLHGNPTFDDDDIFECDIRGGGLVRGSKGARIKFRSSAPQAEVLKLPEGFYMISFTVDVAGYYSLDIKHRKQAGGALERIKHSPFQFECSAKYKTVHGRTVEEQRQIEAAEAKRGEDAMRQQLAKPPRKKKLTFIEKVVGRPKSKAQMEALARGPEVKKIPMKRLSVFSKPQPVFDASKPIFKLGFWERAAEARKHFEGALPARSKVKQQLQELSLRAQGVAPEERQAGKRA